MNYNLICESIENDHSFILSLKTNSNVVKLNDIEENVTPDGSHVFSVKYIFKKPKMGCGLIRVNSQDSTFKTIHSVDLCDKKLQPKCCLFLSPNNKKTQYFKLFNKIFGASDKIKTESFIGDLRRLWPELDPATKVQLIATGINLVIIFLTLVAMVGIKLTKFLKYAKEVYAASIAEKEINEDLFQGQKKDEPAYLIYSKLTTYLNSVINGKQSALILCGAPGTSKSYMVRRVLHFSKKRPHYDYIIQKGATATIDDVYQMLYDCRNGILILDDFDTPIKNPDMINMLKSITDTYKNRIISRPKQRFSYGSPQQEVVSDSPDRFIFNGKIILITNISKDEIDLALRSRAPVIEVNFNTEEVMTALTNMLKFISPSAPYQLKKEVYDYICQLRNKFGNKVTMDFRKFQSSVDARVGVPEEWKDIVEMIVQS